MLGAWRGTPLDEFVEVAPLATEAVALAELRATVVDECSELLVAAGRVDDAIELASRTASDAPLRERSQLVLIQALAGAGRAPDALRHAAAFRRHMAEETGLDPSPALAELEQAVAAGEHAVPRRPAPPSPAEPVSAVDLPGRGLPILGRSDEQRELQELLAVERLVTLIGPGGVGKTRLATELAWLDARTAGFAALAELDDPAALVPALATSIGLRSAPGDEMHEACVARLSAGEVLLVLDNCEHVLSEVREMVDVLLARCPQLTVLATSREPLDLPEEQLFRLGPLPVPPADAARTGSWPSVELFAARAKRVAPGFRIDDATWDAIVEVCRELDGLPLALELAAGRVATLGLDGLRSRMGRMLDVVVGGRARRPGTERHADLVSLVRWSYDLLGPDEARLFRHLAVFVGGFDLTVAERVADALGVPAPTAAVARLAEASLLTVDGDPPRFAMLNTIRAFGEEELDRHGETEGAWALLVDWSVELAGESMDDYYTPHQLRVVARVLTELSNLRAARRIALETDDVGALAADGHRAPPGDRLGDAARAVQLGPRAGRGPAAGRPSGTARRAGRGRVRRVAAGRSGDRRPVGPRRPRDRRATRAPRLPHRHDGHRPPAREPARGSGPPVAR